MPYKLGETCVSCGRETDVPGDHRFCACCGATVCGSCVVHPIGGPFSRVRLCHDCRTKNADVLDDYDRVFGTVMGDGRIVEHSRETKLEAMDSTGARLFAQIPLRAKEYV